MNDAIQAVILISAGLAIYLIARGEKSGLRLLKVWGATIGRIGQPFWLVSSWNTGAWGIFLLTLFFAWSYWLILRANWRVV